MAERIETPPLSHFVARRFAVRSPLLSWALFEPAGGVLAYICARVGVAPWSATVIGGALGVWGAVLLATAADRADAVVALVVLLLSYLLDCVDGQLARGTGRATAMGAWLDVTVDATVIAFVSVALSSALADGSGPVASLLLAGTFGATRMVSLITASRVAASEHGGMKLTGMRQLLRVGFVGAMDTPVVYVALCASRQAPGLFAAVIVVVSLMTGTQTVGSARNHFASVRGGRPS